MTQTKENILYSTLKKFGLNLSIMSVFDSFNVTMEEYSLIWIGLSPGNYRSDILGHFPEKFQPREAKTNSMSCKSFIYFILLLPRKELVGKKVGSNCGPHN